MSFQEFNFQNSLVELIKQRPGPGLTLISRPHGRRQAIDRPAELAAIGRLELRASRRRQVATVPAGGALSVGRCVNVCVRARVRSWVGGLVGVGGRGGGARPHQKETKGEVRAPSAALVCPCVFAFLPPAATSARRPRGVQ